MATDLQGRVLARVGRAIRETEAWLELVSSEWTSQGQVDDAEMHLDIARALRVAVEMCSRNGYTTWDKSMVPLIDGKYEEEATKKWELAHRHDIRLKCYPEFGCQLSIDPEDLLLAIAKELGVGE